MLGRSLLSNLLKRAMGHISSLAVIRWERCDCGRRTMIRCAWLLALESKLTVQYSSTTIQAHKGSISALGASTGSGPLVGHILTGGSDGLIKLWDLSAGKPEVKQTIDLKGKLPLDLQVASLPGSSGTPYHRSGWTELTI